MTNTTKNVKSTSPEVDEMSVNWPMLDALMHGTKAMRDAGEAFLPKFSAEDDDDYKARLSTAVLYPVYSRTCKVMAAKPFSKEPEINGYSSRLMEWLDNCDMEGTNFHTFAQTTALHAIAHGIECVQVDYVGGGQNRTVAEEKQSGARPYFVRWPRGSVLGWRFDKKRGELLQIRLLEQVKEADGEYFEKTIEQVRVLRPGSWETWRKVADRDEWVLHESGTTTIKRIPIVFFYGMRSAHGVGYPLMLDLAFQNVEHWQSSSDQQTILHVARCPLLFAKGFGESDTIKIGSSSACMASSADADLTYVEHTGASISAGRESIADLEERMRKTGAEVLTVPTAQKTATQSAIESEAQRSVMSFFAEALEDSLEELLNLMAEWVNEPAGEVEIVKVFDTQPEAAAE